MVFKQKTIHTNNALNLCIFTYILCIQFPQFVTMPKTIRNQHLIIKPYPQIDSGLT